MGQIKRIFAALSCATIMGCATTSERAPLTPAVQDFYNVLVGFMRHQQIMNVPLEQIGDDLHAEAREAYELEFALLNQELAGTHGRLIKYVAIKGTLPTSTCEAERFAYFSLRAREKRLEAYDRQVNLGKLPGPVIRDMSSHVRASRTRQAQVWVLSNRCDF